MPEDPIDVQTGLRSSQVEKTEEEKEKEKDKPKLKLDDLKKNLTALISKKDATFGAPVLSAQTGKDVVIDDPTWSPPAPTILRKTDPPVEKRNCTAKECSADFVDKSCECKYFRRKCSERECAADTVDPLCLCDNARNRANSMRKCSKSEC